MRPGKSLAAGAHHSHVANHDPTALAFRSKPQRFGGSRPSIVVEIAKRAGPLILVLGSAHFAYGAVAVNDVSTKRL